MRHLAGVAETAAERDALREQLASLSVVRDDLQRSLAEAEAKRPVPLLERARKPDLETRVTFELVTVASRSHRIEHADRALAAVGQVLPNVLQGRSRCTARVACPCPGSTAEVRRGFIYAPPY